MSTAISTQAIEELSQSFKTSNPSGRDEITVEGLRREIQTMLHRGEASGVSATLDEARSAVVDLEAALAAGEFLKQTYDFDPDLNDDAPHFTPEEESFGRSGVFVEA